MKPTQLQLRLLLALTAFLSSSLSLHAQVPADWCQKLPRPAYKNLERVDVRSDWFQVYRVAPGVFAIYEPHQAEEVISYLITGKDRALLLDTGMGIADISAVTAQLTKLPVSVINTHTHNDHVSGNWRFHSIYAMDTAFTRKNALGSLANHSNDAQDEIAPDQLCGKLPAGFDAKNYQVKPFHITDWVHDGSKIDLGGRTLEVLSTPGHTPDSICLLDRAHGLLFTGDTFYLGPIYLYRPETDLKAYAASVARLRKLVPRLKLLLPAHNTPTAAPQYLNRLGEAFAKLQQGKLPSKPRKNPPSVEYEAGDFSFLLAKR
jgi:glyoxylase-like metal-dependent hydrolase (beta-lactamase superfamily II)